MRGGGGGGGGAGAGAGAPHGVGGFESGSTTSGDEEIDVASTSGVEMKMELGNFQFMLYFLQKFSHYVSHLLVLKQEGIVAVITFDHP